MSNGTIKNTDKIFLLGRRYEWKFLVIIIIDNYLLPQCILYFDVVLQTLNTVDKRYLIFTFKNCCCLIVSRVYMYSHKLFNMDLLSYILYYFSLLHLITFC